ncbi:hypothetical protein BDW02DRAFT_48085 [Decorospora gaudefroyi]|uniref:Uncharacterized protein n=1 Tax=Decorospora gaudefroyi TaxID=184978 RepID=A0A6A5K1I7_9PLEO|nr:hypothetical protein BDW02DRAFT_48085 [Decorospora gaudefroyi]
MRWSFSINSRLWTHTIAIERKFLSRAFTRYGNLYFAKDAFPGCEKAEVIGEVSHSLKKELQNRFVIGPVVDRDFWHRERACMSIDRGPCELYRLQPTKHSYTNVTLWGFIRKSPQEHLKAIG